MISGYSFILLLHYVATVFSELRSALTFLVYSCKLCFLACSLSIFPWQLITAFLLNVLFLYKFLVRLTSLVINLLFKWIPFVGLGPGNWGKHLCLGRSWWGQKLGNKGKEKPEFMGEQVFSILCVVELYLVYNFRNSTLK